MTHPRDLVIKNYSYTLPENRIAKYPLADRTSSKLLVYRHGTISKTVFREIGTFLPEKSILVFNDTKVIHARIKLTTQTGHSIECFCLAPENESSLEKVFSSKTPLRWRCMIGNARKWKSDALTKETSGKYGDVKITFNKAGISGSDFLIDISWDNNSYTFSELLELAGELPIPPYLNREAEKEDDIRYNTVYARQEGSVAAPTAGLHFTDDLLQSLLQKGIMQTHVTLHVGAGTFRPVKSETMEGHEMHAERIIVSREVIQSLISDRMDRPVIAVGTTSIRTLESLYWFGVKLLEGEDLKQGFYIDQWIPYQYEGVKLPSALQVLNKILEWMSIHSFHEITGFTQLLIAPGYHYHLVDALITNFHQPDSTLLLLVASLVGEKWRDIYNYALENDFRFLSFGDACLLFREESK